jgi:hypothetical protein
MCSDGSRSTSKLAGRGVSGDSIVGHVQETMYQSDNGARQVGDVFFCVWRMTYQHASSSSIRSADMTVAVIHTFALGKENSSR